MNKKIVAPVEFTDAYFTVSTLTDGRLTVKLQGPTIASLPGIQYGFVLKEGTTRRQAQKLSDMLAEHCDTFFAGFLDRIDDEEFQNWLLEVYDTSGYFDPERRPGPGDTLRSGANNE
jgi:hypothetical protein